VSAAALRAPAPWHRVARAEAAALLRSRWIPALLIGIVLLTMGPLGAESKGPFGEILELTLLMFFLPLLLWRGRGVRGSLDRAMPIGTAAYELIRIGIGAAVALAVMCIATQAHVWVYISQFQGNELAGFAAGYTGALVIRGLAIYLLASAIVLRARRPGRVLLAVFVLGSLALFFLGGMETTTSRLSRAPDGTVTATFGSSLTVGKALLQLAVAAAAVSLSVWMGGREGGLRLPWRRAGGTAPALRTASVPRAALAIPRSPASMRAVAARQFAVQAPRMTWPLLVAAVLALRQAAGGMGLWGLEDTSLYTGSFALLTFVAFLWPALVWVDERGNCPWDEAYPAGAFGRRLLHAAAGLVWLELCVGVLLAGHLAGAAAAGTLASAAWIPAWALPGVPLSVMALYCLGTLPAVLSTRPVRGTVLYMLLLGPALGLFAFGLDGDPSPMGVERLLAPIGLGLDATLWSLPAALVWLPLFGALAVAAIRHRTNVDRGGRAHRPIPLAAN
jgi:hypothetical protein